jgi:hypothetical protein
MGLGKWPPITLSDIGVKFKLIPVSSFEDAKLHAKHLPKMLCKQGWVTLFFKSWWWFCRPQSNQNFLSQNIWKLNNQNFQPDSNECNALYNELWNNMEKNKNN